VPRLSLAWNDRQKPKGAENYDRKLFALLKNLRRRLAEEEDVPPYVVFNDASLAEMAQWQPTTEEELLKINGVGRTKLKKYGDEFLSLLKEY